MYDFYHIYEYITERHKELLKEAETERLIRKNQPKSKKLFNGPRFLLDNLGKILVTWGISLQKRNRVKKRGQVSTFDITLFR